MSAPNDERRIRSALPVARLRRLEEMETQCRALHVVLLDVSDRAMEARGEHLRYSSRAEELARDYRATPVHVPAPELGPNAFRFEQRPQNLLDVERAAAVAQGDFTRLAAARDVLQVRWQNLTTLVVRCRRFLSIPE